MDSLSFSSFVKWFVSFSLLFSVQLPIHHAFPEALSPGVKRELWQAIPGESVVNLTWSLKYQNENPNLVNVLTSLDAPIDIGEDYGQKLTTYFLVKLIVKPEAPETGNYFFLMSCDQSCQLWISRDDAKSRDAEKVLEIKPPGRSTNRDWKKSNSPFYMVDNTFYFLQVLMKEQNGTDFLSVGVDLPRGSSLKPIREPYLYLEKPEQHTGSFILVENAVLPSSGLVRSYSSVSQTKCAHYCTRYVTDCKAYYYHVITRECLLYSIIITQSEMQQSGDHSNRRFCNKMLPNKASSTSRENS